MEKKLEVLKLLEELEVLKVLEELEASDSSESPEETLEASQESPEESEEMQIKNETDYWKSQFDNVIKEISNKVTSNAKSNRSINKNIDIDEFLDMYDHDWFNNNCKACIDFNGPCINANARGRGWQSN
jgi:hypothetical protein